ncbi:glutathione-dependent formaldehyde-activating enzyme [Colletotrichum karsti]|uniref:Glutathione-dependent formaldehyde-activating enzyme n=1 Tax=Colletotrichum karsti TaxID=1095194 RepID=A0A9P6LM89_9PEZI|nr:glutathione-dependent formaldehyde-activating enzyme [Colletotrichum karsti]KAF9878115.1 glutathione-dependent formaldehyde-activating enzyme [Colletotrichum karsti]
MVTTRSMKSEGDQQPEPREVEGQKPDGPRLYRGNCHCGEFVYEAELPEIRSAMECNCSICHKKGYLWVFPAEGSKFEIIKGTKDSLTQYAFGKKSLAHKASQFCPTCATPVMGEFIGGNGRAFNVRAIQGVDSWALEKQPYDGAALGDKYAPPDHQGPFPSDIDGYKPITGSCHCGAVTVAFMSKPIDEKCDDDIAECNCSICMRNAYRWIYPKKERVVLFAKEPSNIGRYSFGRHVLNKTFCNICGVCMTNEYNPLTDEERKALGALPTGGFGERMKTGHPINLRIFPDLDFAKMKAPELKNGANKISPPYKNP